MNKKIHIVCPEIPYSSSAGDMADTYLQLQSLQEAGYAIILHCFYDDSKNDVSHLQQITTAIHLYPRNQGHKGISINYPYCISSRSNPLILENILQHFCPVIFQGIKVTFHLPELAANGYKTIVRINGIASQIYESFIKCEKSLLKKAYSFNEARLIRKWEEKISEHAVIATTTVSDKQQFSELYPIATTKCIAPFLPKPAINTLTGRGMYCLYYGDMSNPENERMAHWLSEQVFSKIPIPFIVADTCAAIKTRDANHPESNICTVSNSDEATLHELIQKAQIVVLTGYRKLGFDKRLIQALEKGRYCICNSMMTEDNDMGNFFIVANSCNAIAEAVEHYFSCDFSEQEIEKRTELLQNYCVARQPLKELVSIINE